MGIKGLFDFNSFNNIVHKAVTEVREEVTTAGMGNSTLSTKPVAMPSCLDSVPTIISFHCDRPFAYAIFDRISRNVIFVGIYRGQENENLSIK